MTIQPTTPKGRRTRDHLVNAGRAVFAREGYVHARMGDVVEEAEISMGGLYRYFKNKEDLFAEVIADLHEHLFHESRPVTTSLKSDPRLALYESNFGYLRIYLENAGVMRAFIQAAHVEERFREIWWQMRERHIDRFCAALSRDFDLQEIDGVPARVSVEALACMTEQSAYVWFAQEDRREYSVSLEQAAGSVTRTWYTTFFA